MKHRIGFVSNSSSSSFILDMDWMTPEQIKKIKEWLGYEESYYEEDNELHINVGCDSDIKQLFYEINLGCRAIKDEQFHG